MPAKDHDDARFDEIGAQISGRAARDPYEGDGRSAVSDAQRTHHCPLCEANARKAEALNTRLAQSASARESELEAESARLREANRRLQAEGPALERDKVIAALRDENERLARWKREARFLALGSPGRLGKSKADSVLAECQRLLAQVFAAQLDAASYREQWEKAQADAAAIRETLQMLRDALNQSERWRDLFEQEIACIDADLTSPNLGAPLLAELASLREQAAAVKGSDSEPEPPEYQRTNDGEIC